MTYDGIYWHYLDIWIFSLLRFGQAPKETKFIKDAAGTGKNLQSPLQQQQEVGGGCHWKLTSDLNRIPGLLAYPSPNDDALSALIVFSAVEAELLRNPQLLISPIP